MLRALLLEDSPQDIEIIRELLIDAGFDLDMDCTAVEKEFASLLHSRTYDLILADFKLPGFDGFGALRWAMEICPNVPLIFISGTIGEETAVELLKQGAVDYVFKDRPVRLPSAIKRALVEAKEKETRRRAEEELHVALSKYKTLFDCFPLGITVSDDRGNIIETNPTAEKLLDLPKDDQIQRDIDSQEWHIVRPDGTPMASDEYASVRALKQKCKIENVEMGIVKPGNIITWINVTATPVPLDGYGVVITYNDITERKKAEQQVKKINRVYALLSNINQAIVRIHDIEQLLKDVCLIAVDEGKFQSARIRIVNTETKKIETAATAGLTNDYFNNIANDLTKKNPLTNVIRSGKHFISNNISADSKLTEIWKQNFLSLGFRSFSVCPLIVHEKVIGSFCIYSNEIDFFDTQEISLLDEVAADISFAIEFIQKEAERKHAEELLLESEERYRSVSQSANDAIITTDSKGIILGWNKGAEKIFGYTEAEITGTELTVIIPQGYREQHINGMRRIEQGGEHHVVGKTVELHGLHKSGEEFPLELSLAEWETKNGKFFTGIIRDITERRKYEDKLQEKEKKFKELFDNAPIGYHELDLQGRITRINHTELDMLGYTEEEMIGQFVWKFVGDEAISQQRVLEKLKGVHPPAKSQESVYRRKDLTTFPILIEEVILRDALDNITGIRTTIQDITLRKRTEEVLKVNEKRYKELFDNAPIGYHELDLQGRITRVNRTELNMLGYTEEEMIGQFVWKFLGDENISRQRVIDKLKGIISPSQGDERIYRRKDMTLFPVIVEDKILRDTEDGIIGILTTIQDITERKRAEEEITMLAHSLRSVNECVSITDMEDKIIFVNQSFLKTYGYDENELIGKWISKVRSQNNPPELVKEILPATISGGWQGELWNKRKDGSEFQIHLSTTLIKDKDDNPLGLIGVTSDITERKRAEKELIEAKEKAEQSDRLKTEFLAQMSHEIRSPMNAIISFANIIKEDLEEKITPDIKEYFFGIDSAGHRLIRTVDMILNSSELQIGTYEPIFTEFGLIGDIIKRIENDFKIPITEKSLKYNFISNIREAVIHGDKYTVYQLFVNLIDNAVKYTQKGSITVKVEKNEDGQEIKVIIEDTGIGMSEEFMTKMYLPFVQEDRGYSRSYEGNGLGLLLVKKYCELNGITIGVESKKGIGSKFTLTFTGKINANNIIGNI